MATWADIARIVGGLPGTAETSPRNWRVGKKLIAWERPLRMADYAALGAEAPEGDILGARVADEGVKFALIADDPGVYSPPRISTGTRRCWCALRRSACPSSKS